MRVRVLAGRRSRSVSSVTEPDASTGTVVAATESAFAAAAHLTPTDEGAKAALLALARKIDVWDVIVEWAEEDAAEDGGRPKVPQNDNVSISAYLKGCEQLGLTPSGRATLSMRLDRYVRSAPAEPVAEPTPDEAQVDDTKLGRVTALRAKKKA